MSDDKYKPDCDRCRSSKHSDGASHGWLFWGDDPYIKCEWCGEIRDALTGRVVRAVQRANEALQPKRGRGRNEKGAF